MKAAVLHNFGDPLSVEQVTDPAIGTGEVLVDVVAAPVLSYTGEVLSGARRYLLPTPVVPGAGAIGRVRAVGPDATRLRPGDWVFCDPARRRAHARHHLAGRERPTRGRAEAPGLLPRWHVCRAGPRADGECRTHRRDRPSGGWTVVLDRHVADRLWRLAGDGLSARRNTAGEWGHRQLRLGYRGVGAGDGRTLRGGPGPQRCGAGRPAPALRRAPEAGAADGRCGGRHAGDARGGTGADRRGAGFPPSLGQCRRGARRHYDAATGR